MLKFSSNYKPALIFVVFTLLGLHSVSAMSISNGVGNITEDVAAKIDPIDRVTRASKCLLPSYISIKGRHYYFELNLELSHSDASKHCQKLNMELVSIEDCEEDNYLTNMIRSYGLDCYSKRFWTSGYRNKGNFYWGTEAPFVYNNWQYDEPNNKYDNENCVEIKYLDLQWNDSYCGDTNNFICESANNPENN